MTGLIWFVQIVHYPMFKHVGAEAFRNYEHLHQRLTTWVVAPPMLTELLSALLLLFWGPIRFPMYAAVIGLALLLLIWLSTAFVQVPKHRSLSNAYDAGVIDTLVLSNWIRTILWSVRAIMLLYFAVQLSTLDS